MHSSVAPGGGSTAAAWYAAIKPYCNPVELDVELAARPAPAGSEGAGFRAERAREALAARLRDTVTAIARLRVESRMGPAAADARALESLTRELELEARHYQDAVSEVAALLRDLPE